MPLPEHSIGIEHDNTTISERRRGEDAVFIDNLIALAVI